MLDELFREYEFGDFTALDVSANLAMALVLALLTSVTYRWTHTGYSYSRSFNVTLVSVAMTIAMIMMIIGNYWVLSLGLVGALSVIRFRSAIKDPKDIAYLFLVIAIGLACSTGNYTISVVGTLFINAALVGMHLLKFGAAPQSGYCLTLLLHDADSSVDDMLAGMQARGFKTVFRSCAQASPELSEYVYTVDLGRRGEQELVAYINDEVSGVERFSLLAPETNVEL